MLALSFAWAFEPVKTDLGGGAYIDWSTLELAVEADRRPLGSQGTKAVEELARRDVDLRMGPAARRIPTAPREQLAGLEATPELWAQLEPRIGRWVETENRYFASGRVSVVGSLSLVELLKPWVMSTATTRTIEESEHSGVILDARGAPVGPCFAPQLVSADGEVVYEGQMWLESATTRGPAVWVSDAAHPAADRAGSTPFATTAAGAKGCVITLAPTDAEKVTELAELGIVADGRLVIVVDP